jgi:NADH dehydrogenase FAD-containing subunit
VQEKEVTIVHGDNELLNPTYKASFRKALEKGLRARGVKIILNDFIDEFPAAGPAVVKTRNGHHIDADLVVCLLPSSAFAVTHRYYYFSLPQEDLAPTPLS